MAFHTLEHRNIAEIDWMLEGLGRSMARLAFPVGEAAKINRVLEGAGLRIFFGLAGRVIEHRMADVAIIPDYLACTAHVLAVVATEAAGRSQVTNVVGMSLPVGLHLGKEVDLINALNLRDCTINRSALLRVKSRVVRTVVSVDARCDGLQCFIVRSVRLT